MTLAMKWVANCNDCGEVQVLHTMERHEAMLTLRMLHWRHVVRDAGQETLCSRCADRYDDHELARIAERSGKVRPEIELIRGRKRPGWMPCPGCGLITPMSSAFYLPLEAYHHANLRCLRCCVKHAAMRGYMVDVAKYLPREEVSPAPVDEAPSLF